MRARTLACYGGRLVCITLLLTLIGGHILGIPVLFSYVETGSMEPTMNAGDGFVAIPTIGTDSVDEGDVVVFEAENIDDGGLTTHRIVEDTEQGYVTQGDANPSTDQEGEEPYVTDGQIVATAWQINGEVVTIPHLGTAVMSVESGLEAVQGRFTAILGTTAVFGTQGFAYLLLAFGLGSLAFSLIFDQQGSKNRTRNRTRSRQAVFDTRTLVLGVAALLCVVTFGTMLAMSGPTEVGIVSAEFESDRPDVIPAGETETRTWKLQNGGVLPVTTVVEPGSEGLTVNGGDETLQHGESVNATVSITAPDETGYYLRSFAAFQYFTVLPPRVILVLHAIHPWVAMTAVTGTIVGLCTLPFALLLGGGKIRTRTRRRTDSSNGFNW